MEKRYTRKQINEAYSLGREDERRMQKTFRDLDLCSPEPSAKTKGEPFNWRLLLYWVPALGIFMELTSSKPYLGDNSNLRRYWGSAIYHGLTSTWILAFIPEIFK